MSADGPPAGPAVPAGSALLDAVAVMDRLRSPGGCPWDAAQTPASLLRHLVEETYELYDALAAGDRAAVREELGDVLLQVLFHARIASEEPGGFDVDDVARDLVTKLVGRHPHVFAADPADPLAGPVTGAGDQDRRWEQLKALEKRRDSVLDGVAAAQPGAALLAEYVTRARRAGVPEDLLRPAAAAKTHGGVATGGVAGAVVDQALAGGDPEGALRAAATGLAAHLRGAEAAARAAGETLGPDAGAAAWRRHWPTGPAGPPGANGDGEASLTSR